MTDHSREEQGGGTAGSASLPERPQGDPPGPQAEARPVSPARPATGRERRRPGGRHRPYRALRILAKLYAILAPLVLIGLVLVGVAGLMRSAPLGEKIGSTVGILLLAGLYYLLMKAISDAIYILFDIAAHTRRIHEVVVRDSEPI